MISVFGATGKVGGRVAAMALEAGIPVRALIRSPERAAPLVNEGAEIVIGSMLDLQDVRNAMDRCDGAFLMTPINAGGEDYVQEEIAIGRNYGEALKDSTVRHAVYMSVIAARGNTGIPHFDSKAQVEDAIASAGVDCTILRPAFFMENFYSQASMIRDMGIISFPIAADKPMPMVATEDIAYVAGQSLHRGPRGPMESYDILGPRDFTMNEVAAVISRIVGKEVRYVRAPAGEAEQHMRQAGFSAAAARDFVRMGDMLPDLEVEEDRQRVYVEFNFDPAPIETVLGNLAVSVAAG